MKRPTTGKTKHFSFYAAKLHLQALAKTQGEICNPYHCKHCGGWHVGHTK